jgi:hypothetical protein
MTGGSAVRKVFVVVFIGVFFALSLSSGAQGRVVIGGYFGFPYPYPYAYYGYYPFPYSYGYPYYYPYAYPYPYYDSYRYNPPTVYVEQEQPFYWYFCQDSQTYYPYVTSCPGGWTKVIPTPPEAEKEGTIK